MLLTELLENFDDGKRKSYFCLAVNLLDLTDTESVMAQLENLDRQSSSKEKASAAVRLFEEIAQKHGVILKLRKPQEKETRGKAL